MTQTTSDVITVDQFLPHRPGRVWQALTDPAKLSIWFMPTDFAPVVGRTFFFDRCKPNPELRFGRRIQCQVLDIRPEELLSYSWTEEDQPGVMDTTVTWTLHPEGAGTRLLLEHRGFAGDTVQQMARTLMDDGWGIYVTHRLSVHLQTLVS